MGSITSTIGLVNSTTASMAEACEQRTASADKIARNVNSAADASRDLAGNLGAACKAAKSTGVYAQDAHDAATDLAQRTGRLCVKTARLLKNLKAA